MKEINRDQALRSFGENDIQGKTLRKSEGMNDSYMKMLRFLRTGIERAKKPVEKRKMTEETMAAMRSEIDEFLANYKNQEMHAISDRTIYLLRLAVECEIMDEFFSYAHFISNSQDGDNLYYGYGLNLYVDYN